MALLTNEQRQELEIAKNETDDSYYGIDLDAKLVDSLAATIQETFPNLDQATAQQHAQTFLEKFDGKAHKAAEFLLDIDEMPKATFMLESTNDIDSFIQANTELIDAYQAGTIEQFLADKPEPPEGYGEGNTHMAEVDQRHLQTLNETGPEVVAQLTKLMEDGEISWGEKTGYGFFWGDGLDEIIMDRYKFADTDPGNIGVDEFGRMDVTTGAEKFKQEFMDNFGSPEAAAEFLIKTADVPELNELRAVCDNNAAMQQLERDLSHLHNTGQLDDFIDKIKSNPNYRAEIAESLDGPSGYQNATGQIMDYAAQPDAPPAPDPSVDPNVSLDQLALIEEFLNDHVARNPEDAGLRDHFMQGVVNDPKLQEALAVFAANNAEILNPAEGDDLMAGFFDKDAMVHDLLDSYKNTPDKAYAALKAEDFQQQAFMQYSSIGQAFGHILQPILDWINELFGGAGGLADWMNMDFGAIFQDFTQFFGNNMNNVMAMSNGDLSLSQSLNNVVNAAVGAGKDAVMTTDLDRQYMSRHNPDAPTFTYVDGSNVQQVDLNVNGNPVEAANQGQNAPPSPMAPQNQNEINPNEPPIPGSIPTTIGS